MRLTYLTVPTVDLELATARMWGAGAAAVEERSSDDDLDDSITLVTVLAADDVVSTSRLGELPPNWVLTFGEDATVPSEAWRDHVGPVVVNDELVLSPAWLDSGPPTSGDRPVVIRIEPGGAFGLGDHPTTRLSADSVWRLTRPGDHVLDVGAGSGVLAITALLRGAGRVNAIDVSEAAREATTSNAVMNGVDARLTASCEPLADVEGVYDLVVANILAPTLIELSAHLRRVVRPGGRLVVSGILSERHDHVVAALQPFHAEVTNTLDAWACVELINPAYS